MAASVNISVKISDKTGVSSKSTAAFTIGGSNRVLYVAALSGAATPVIPTAVKWGGSGGTALTQVGSTLTLDINWKFALFRLTAPAAQNSTVFVDWGSAQDEVLVIAVAVQDADQSTPNGTVATATGTNNAPSVTVASVSGDLTLDFAGFGDGAGGNQTLTVNGSQSSLQEIEGTDTAFEGLGSSTKAASSSSTVMSWSTSGTPTAWGSFGLNVNAVAAPVDQGGFRARNDDGSETAATFRSEAQNANFIAPIDTALRLRLLLDATGDPPSRTPRLEYKLSTDSTYIPVLTAAPALPTFQAAGAAVNGIGAVTPAWPAHQSGDIALLFVESCGGEAATLSTPAGFAAVANSPQATGAGTAGTQLTVFWCRATSSAMSSPTVADPGDHAYAVILTFRGCVAEGNPWDVTGGGVKASASTSLSMTGVTTTVDNCLMVYACTKDLDATAAFLSAQADANLASITERADAGTTAGNGGGIAVTTGTLASHGASGTMTATVTSSINAFMCIALRPQSIPILMQASSNIASGGEATTALLTPPSGKTTSNFQTGRMWDDENGLDALDLTTDSYTEVEWCINALAANGAANGQQYNFRVTDGGTALSTYTQTPTWTVGVSVTTSPSATALTLTQASPTASGGASNTLTAQALTLTQGSATASGGGAFDGTGNASSQALTLTQADPALTGDANTSTTAQALTLTQGAAVATPSVAPAITAQALTLTQQSVASVTGGGTGSPSAIALTMTPAALVVPGSRKGLIGVINTGSNTVQIRQSGSALKALASSGDAMTLIHRVQYFQQAGYYSTFFWTGNPGAAFSSETAYFGCHPYPDGGGSGTTTHSFEISADFADDITDDNGHSTAVTKGIWYTQIIIASLSGTTMTVKFYWDASRDITKVITTSFAWGARNSPCLAMLSTPWETYALVETHYGILRGMQQYSKALSLADAQTEAANELLDLAQTTDGIAHLWFMNQNPIPSDVTDKSGNGHDFVWVDSAHKASLYQEGDGVVAATALTLTQADPAVNGTGNVTLTAQALTLTQGAAVATPIVAPDVTAQALTLTQADTSTSGGATATLTAQALTLTEADATGTGSSQADATGDAGTTALAMVQQSAAGNGSASVALSATSLSLTQADAAAAGYGVGSPAAIALALTQGSVTTATAETAAPSETSLTVTQGILQATGAGNVTLTTQALTLTQQAATASNLEAGSPAATSLTISQQAVAMTGTGVGSPAVSVLALTQGSAVATNVETAAPSAQSLTMIQGDAAATGTGIAEPSTQALTLTQGDALGTNATIAQVTTVALTLTQATAAGTGDATASPAATALSLTQLTPSAGNVGVGSPDAQALSLTQASPSATGTANVTLSPIGLSLTQGAVQATGTAVAAISASSPTLVQPSVAASGGPTVVVSATSLTLTQVSPTISGGGTGSPSATALTMTPQAPAETGTAQAAPSAQTLTISQAAVQAGGYAQAQITTQVLTLSQQQAAAAGEARAQAAAVALVLSQAVAAASGSAVVSLTAQALLLGQAAVLGLDLETAALTATALTLAQFPLGAIGWATANLSAKALVMQILSVAHAGLPIDHKPRTKMGSADYFLQKVASTDGFLSTIKVKDGFL